MRFLIVILLIISLLSMDAGGCLWDGDTLAMERSRFPGIAELITGSFPRHSKEYHEWRVKDRERRIAAGEADAMDYHDLAVSQHKLGDHEAAIKTMQSLEKVMPRMYETYSNLGTFYIYAGDLPQALVYIDKALAINANAHFGREKYQKWLVEWLMDLKADGRDGNERPTEVGKPPSGFARFVAFRNVGLSPKSGIQPTLPENERRAAIRGITGMMLFADFDNPVLLEALGDLLQTGKMEENAAQLAGLCYLHAAWKTPDETEKQRLRKLSEEVGRTSLSFKQEEAEALLKRGLKHGEAFAEAVRQDELAWIKAGKDAAAEYEKKYLKPTQASR